MKKLTIEFKCEECGKNFRHVKANPKNEDDFDFQSIVELSGWCYTLGLENFNSDIKIYCPDCKCPNCRSENQLALLKKKWSKV